MTIIREVHKWIGLLLGLQLLLWMFSGLGMAILPHAKVAGDHHRVDSEPGLLLAEVTEQIAPPLSGSASDVRRVELRLLSDRAVFQVDTGGGAYLLDAASGSPIAIDESGARQIAARDYSGDAGISTVRYLEHPTLEIRDHAGPAWQVNFSDPERTSLYVSAETGDILERRNNYWRTFDTLWMLHIMDYSNRSNFNNPLVILSALILFWLGLSGLVLWWDSFHREDFRAIVSRLTGKKPVLLSVASPSGDLLKTVRTPGHQTLYAALEAEGYALPSSCGGGGSCGLCKIKTSPDSPATAADRRQIPEADLDRGVRLACQHRLSSDVSVTLPDGLLDARRLDGEVVSSRRLTPDMFEIRIALPAPLEFRSGSYIEVEIPPYSTDLDQINLPDPVKSLWRTSGTGERIQSARPLVRTYSLANAPGETGSEVTLIVRLVLAGPEHAGAPVGLGSAYMTSRRPGDTLSLRGPLGDFHVGEHEEERVFIGGGAGIAPLRSMIRNQLLNKGSTSRMWLWYGARTPEALAYREEFEQLATDFDNFSWQVALSHLEPHQEWEGHKGWIHEIFRDNFLATHPDPGRCSFYVCGPPPMLEAVLNLLRGAGIREEKIAFDDFGI